MSNKRVIEVEHGLITDTEWLEELRKLIEKTQYPDDFITNVNIPKSGYIILEYIEN